MLFAHLNFFMIICALFFFSTILRKIVQQFEFDYWHDIAKGECFDEIR